MSEDFSVRKDVCEEEIAQGANKKGFMTTRTLLCMEFIALAQLGQLAELSLWLRTKGSVFLN